MQKYSIKYKALVTEENATIDIIKQEMVNGEWVNTFGWRVPVELQAGATGTISLDPSGVADQLLQSHQDIFPFGCRLAVYYNHGPIAHVLTDIYYPGKDKANNILRKNNIETSVNRLYSLTVSGKEVTAKYSAGGAGILEILEVVPGDTLENSDILAGKLAVVEKDTTSITAVLDKNVDGTSELLARWHDPKVSLPSGYMSGRREAVAKELRIESHEVVGGKLIFKLFDGDTLGAFRGTGLLLKATQGATSFILSGKASNTPTRTLFVVEDMDKDRLLGLKGAVQMTAEVVGDKVTSNTYEFVSTAIVPKTGTNVAAATDNPEVVFLNTSVCALFAEEKRMYIEFFAGSKADIEAINIVEITNGTEAVLFDKPLFNAFELQRKPFFGKFIKFNKEYTREEMAAFKIKYTYRLKGKVDVEMIANMADLQCPEINLRVNDTDNTLISNHARISKFNNGVVNRFSDLLRVYTARIISNVIRSEYQQYSIRRLLVKKDSQIIAFDDNAIIAKHDGSNIIYFIEDFNPLLPYDASLQYIPVGSTVELEISFAGLPYKKVVLESDKLLGIATDEIRNTVAQNMCAIKEGDENRSTAISSIDRSVRELVDLQNNTISTSSIKIKSTDVEAFKRGEFVEAFTQFNLHIRTKIKKKTT